MKDTMDEQGVGATAFDLSNNQNPWPYAKAFHTKSIVPKPTNEAAKKVNESEIMRHVNQGR